MTEWYYSKMGLQQGPVPEAELLTKVCRGEIGGTNLVWKEGMPEWKLLSEMPELMASSTYSAPGPVSPQAMVHPDTSWERPVMNVPVPQSGGNVPLPQPPAYHGNYVAPRIPNYMWQSVLATVVGLPFCCLLAMPFGIVAIVFAAKVEGLRVSGDVLGATSASTAARNWMIASFSCSGIGIVINVISLVARSV